MQLSLHPNKQNNRHVARRLLWTLVEGVGLEDCFVEDGNYEDGKGGVHRSRGFIFRQTRKIAEGEWNRLICRSLLLMVAKMGAPIVNSMDLAFFAGWDMKLTLADVGDLPVSETGMACIWHHDVLMQCYHAAQWRWSKSDFSRFPKVIQSNSRKTNLLLTESKMESKGGSKIKL